MFLMRVLLFVFILISSFSFAQSNLYLSFKPKCLGNDLILGDIVQDINGVSMKINHFNYYISNIVISYDGNQTLDLSDTVLLVKADANTFFLGNYNIPNIEKINFSVGVPEPLNHLDISLYPSNHFLSFQSPSMHWGWTSGYALVLVDGKGDSNNDGSPEANFSLHTFGDNNFKSVELPITATYINNSQIDIVINTNLDQWIYGVNPGDFGVVHGTNGPNSSTMNNVNDRPVFTSPFNASIKNIDDNGHIYFLSSQNGIKVFWQEMQNISYYELIDFSGSVLNKSKSTKIKDDVVFNDLSKGNYIFSTYDSQGNRLKSIKIVY